MNRFLCLTCLILAFGCKENPGKTPEEKIDYVVTQAFQNGDFVGSVLVANQGKVIYQKNFGMADAEREIPVNDSTQFLIASVSKPITAILLLQMAEQGKPRLDDPLSKFFNVDDKAPASKVTVHQLLTHTSGIKELISEDHPFEEADLTHAEFNFEPGSDFSYSNSEYVILKEIAKRISGKDFEKLIREQICDRAQLHAFGVANNTQQIPNLALGYETSKQEHSIKIGYPLATVDGAGSLYSTANDLFKLDRALYTEKLLSKKSIDLMQKQHVKERFGYGWFLSERNGIWDVMYHEGSLPGYSSYFSRRTSNDEAIILLSNSNGLDLGDLENEISQILKFDN